MEKPNFERLSILLIPEWAPELILPLDEMWEEISNSEIPFPKDSLVNEVLELNKTRWDKIMLGEITYPERQLFNELIQSFEFQNWQSDLRYLGYIFSRWIMIEQKGLSDYIHIEAIDDLEEYLELENCNDIEYIEGKKDFENFISSELELLQTLNILYEKKGMVEFEIKHLTKIESITIQNQFLINTIKERLFELYKKHCRVLSIDPDCKTEDDWLIHFKSRIIDVKLKTLPKGRKQSNKMILRIVFLLHKYLQRSTPLTASGKTFISRKQANFIYQFLEIYGIIGEKSRKEDTITYWKKR